MRKRPDEHLPNLRSGTRKTFTVFPAYRLHWKATPFTVGVDDPSARSCRSFDSFFVSHANILTLLIGMRYRLSVAVPNSDRQLVTGLFQVQRTLLVNDKSRGWPLAARGSSSAAQTPLPDVPNNAAVLGQIHHGALEGSGWIRPPRMRHVPLRLLRNDDLVPSARIEVRKALVHHCSSIRQLQLR